MKADNINIDVHLCYSSETTRQLKKEKTVLRGDELKLKGTQTKWGLNIEEVYK